MKCEILALAAHPDDVELSCGGTIIKHTSAGHKVVVADFTKGEMGTRGNPKLRMKEAASAGKILGLSARVNLGMKDVFFTNDNDHRIEVAKIIRHYQPEILLINAPADRHPDHGKAAQLAIDAAFMSGLAKVETRYKGKIQKAWRPKRIYHYIQCQYFTPSFVIEITKELPKKMEAIRCFSSQFYSSNFKGPETFISTPEFIKFIEARSREMGQILQFEHAEGFVQTRYPGVKSLLDLL